MPSCARRWMLLLSVAAWTIASAASAANLQSASSTTFTITGGTFETPALPASPGYEYAPAGAAWTWGNGAGLTRSGTAFTAGNPSAPQGAQVLFLQTTGSASQTIDFPAGYYAFTFWAAQRANLPSNQTFSLRVDRIAIQSFTP